MSEGDGFSATPESSIHTEGHESQQQGSPAAQPASVPETPLASVLSSPANYTQDFTSASPSPNRQVSINGFTTLAVKLYKPLPKLILHVQCICVVFFLLSF